MRRASPGVLALFLVLSGCQTASPRVEPVSGEELVRLRSLVASWQEKAFSPRRLKALYSVETNPKVGPIMRGYVSFFWDGETLVWRASAPMAGNVRGGTIERDGFESTGLLPLDIPAADVVGVFLGVPGWDIVNSPVFAAKDGYRLVSGTREMVFSPGRGVLSQSLPNRISATFEPGDGLPRAITVAGPDGKAVFRMQSLLPWPAGEGVPPE